MSDNVPMPKNYRRRRDKAVTEAPRLVAQLCEDFETFKRLQCPVAVGVECQAAIKELLRSYEFYKSRWDELCKHYPKFREPERTVVIEIIAAGKSDKAKEM